MPNVSQAVGSGHNDCLKYQTKPGTTWRYSVALILQASAPKMKIKSD